MTMTRVRANGPMNNASLAPVFVALSSTVSIKELVGDEQVTTVSTTLGAKLRLAWRDPQRASLDPLPDTASVIVWRQAGLVAALGRYRRIEFLQSNQGER